MNAKLIEPGSELEPATEYPLKGEEFLIGRGNDCDLRVRDSDVSRHHCMIRNRGNEVTLIDLGSSNGTFVNGHRVISQSTLKGGDEIRIGKGRFFVDFGDGIGSPVADVDPLAHTNRFTAEQMRQMKESVLKEENHPQGDAGGRGNVS